MLSEPTKHIKKLNSRISSLNQKDFTEDEIELLLINIREYLSKEKFLREICDFVAHPKRNRGICHKRVDSRYAKMKFIKEGYQKIDMNNLVKEHKDKPWSFFSDKVLDYIQVEKIDKQKFELIILEGIEEIDEELFLKYYKLTKEQVRNIVKKAYKKENGIYHLNPKLNKGLKNNIDDLLKFIRGTITGKPAFEQAEIESEFTQAINRIQVKHSFSKLTFDKGILGEIVLCILCILHNVVFDLFDGSQGISYLSIEKNRENPELSTLNLMAKTNNFSFPIISTELKVVDFVENSNDVLESGELNELTNIKRTEKGEIKLTKHSA